MRSSGDRSHVIRLDRFEVRATGRRGYLDISQNNRTAKSGKKNKEGKSSRSSGIDIRLKIRPDLARLRRWVANSKRLIFYYGLFQAPDLANSVAAVVGQM
jgi:hypothetical protein